VQKWHFWQLSVAGHGISLPGEKVIIELNIDGIFVAFQILMGIKGSPELQILA